jgi:hypothetical protein
MTGKKVFHYFDSGLLVKLYHLEAVSEVVARLVSEQPFLPLPFLAEMEIRNALRVLYGRGQIRAEILNKALGALDDDITSRRLIRVTPNPMEIQESAETLSDFYSSMTLCRTLDLLHVSHAWVLEAVQFHTGDKTQALLAEKSGLNVNLISFNT